MNAVSNQATTSITNATLLHRIGTGITTATTRAVSRTSTALVPFGAVVGAKATARAVSRTSTALVPFGAVVGAEATTRAVSRISTPLVPFEMAAVETPTLLGKVAALGKSAWALAVAHPVIAAVAVAATIAVPTLILMYQRSKANSKSGDAS